MFDQKILLPHQYYYPALKMLGDRVTSDKKETFIKKLKGGTKEVLLYIHIPFCDSHCAFCGFDKKYNLEEITKYLDKVKEELRFYSQFGYKIQNIHFGGGTPSLVPGKQLKELVSFIKELYDCSPDMDINMEGSATSIWRDDIIEFIKECNIARTSVGVQTFYAGMREIFQTQATLEQVYHTLETLKKNHISVFTDILFGYPDFGLEKTPEEIVKADIQEAIRLGVNGIDFSQIFPYGNKLSKIIEEKELHFPTTGQIISHMQECMDHMEENGYHQETSYGFVRDGRIIMETSYYGGVDEVVDTLAIGSSAFGLLNGFRYRNAMYPGYMRQPVPAYMHVKELTENEKDQINIVGFSKLLKLKKSLVEKSFQKENFYQKLQELVDMGMVREESDSYFVTKTGRYYVDNIYYYLLDQEERDVISKEMQMVIFDK